MLENCGFFSRVVHFWLAVTHIRQIKSASQRIFLEVFQLLILIAIAGRSLNEHLKVSMLRFGKGDHKLLKRKLAFLYLQNFYDNDIK